MSGQILIVEDEGIIALDLSAKLMAMDYQVTDTVVSGEQAIASIETTRPDLVMMDIVLKGAMTGTDAAQIIRDRFHIPVIYLTAYSDPNTLRRAKATAPYGFLIKPFRQDELRAAIEVALYKHTMERRLKESEQWFAKTLHCISDGVIATDTGGQVKFINPVAETATGWRAEEAIGKSIDEILVLIDEESRAPVSSPVGRALRSGSVAGLDRDTLLVDRSGRDVPVDDGAAPIRDEHGQLLGSVLVFRDISARRAVERALRESEERFHSAFDHAAIGMALVGIDGRFLQVNAALCEIVGYTAEELADLSLQALSDPPALDAWMRHERDLLADELPTFQTETCYRHKTGRTLWAVCSVSLVRDQHQQPLYFITQIQDVTARKCAEERLVYLANYDPLTGLCNRAQLDDRLQQALLSAHRHGNKVALMFLDLDQFKAINDTLGHQAGDDLLRSVAERLKKTVRANDTLARLGGDEFVVILSDVKQTKDIARIAEKMLNVLSLPYHVAGQDLVVTASIGISVYPNDGENVQALLMCADTAMYRAKERGKNKYQFYTADMTGKAVARLTLEKGLRQALSRDEFLLHYQPQMNVAKRQPTSVEALLRWLPSGQEMVMPGAFITLAEETGLIRAIGEWVLVSACQQGRAWQQAELPFARVAVNLSARQFLGKDLIGTVANALNTSGLDPNCLELEITESSVMREPEQSIKTLHALHEMGVHLSVDDFGTGYSSLSYLKQFPLNRLKIDKSFIRDIPTDQSDVVLVKAMIALAHELNLRVTAEGVESHAQYTVLEALHCDEVQGFLLCKPADAGAIASQFLQ